MADRFVVRSITGYSGGSGAVLSTSYWVLDLDYARVVATFYSRDHQGDSDKKCRKHAAEARCRYLNEQYRRWLHSGRWLEERA